ncbi:hypothetical protein TNCT_732721 [Trichonephila clavata]|uniref:Uncharacterized protein n=1 Tax=Trichonephila clavata TaxID=2740835 RepID=A0A8X6H4Z0_TRICU|nr:hypothetical protein TNCT_732721 [Trichonephila clavata]
MDGLIDSRTDTGQPMQKFVVKQCLKIFRIRDMDEGKVGQVIRKRYTKDDICNAYETTYPHSKRLNSRVKSVWETSSPKID